MTCTLPLELVLAIIASVDQNEDQKSLASLSQTCSAYLKPCQRLLFSHLHIGASYTGKRTKGSTPGERLLELFSLSPHVIPYVKRITLSDFDNPWVSWLPNDMKLVEALDKMDLDKIEGFCLKRHYRASWALLSDPVGRVILEICQSSVLTDLSLWQTPLVLISVCGPSLKRLEVHDCETVAYAPDVTPTLHATEISLQSLKLYHSSNLAAIVDYIQDPSNRVRIDHLHTLHVKMSGWNDNAQLPRLLQHCQNSLETLELVPSDYISSPVQLPVCYKLTKLDIEVDATAPNSFGRRFCPAWAAGTVATIPRFNVVDTIRLKLIFDLSNVPGELGGSTGMTLLSSLQGIGRSVLEPGAFPHLKALRVDIHSTNPERDDAYSIRNWTRNALSIPPERGILHLRTVYCPR